MAPGAIPRRLAVTVGFTTTVGRAWLRISSSRDPRHTYSARIGDVDDDSTPIGRVLGTYRNRHARRVDAVPPMPGDEMSDAQSTRSASVRSESDVYRAVWNTVKGSMGNLVE